MTATALAELADKLEESVKCLGTDEGWILGKNIRDIAAELRTLADADSRDAARYRWLRDRDVWTTAYGGTRWSMQIRQAKATEGLPFIIANYGMHLDAAIDAALATEGREG